MKKAMLLLALVLTSGFGFAQKGQQTVGLLMGVNRLTYFEFYDNEFRDGPFTESEFSPLAGVYYDYNISNRLGINLATRFLVSKTEYDCSECRFIDAPAFPLKSITKLSYLEIPVNLALNLNKKETASWKSYVLFGYTHSRLIQAKRTDLSTGKEEKLDISADFRTNHYLNAGYEVRHTIKDKYELAFNPYFQFDFLGAPTRNFLGLQVKIGKSWNR
ncbi:outer membrane beta-barrel protein [Adhaeribacter soli]|nr:outer membrane beta-barrel protein [Adhaeribacter soli]